MSAVDSSKVAALRTMLTGLPDAAVISLRDRLSAADPTEPGAAQLRRLARAEVEARQARNRALAPVVALCRTTSDPLHFARLPACTAFELWRWARADAHDLVDTIIAAHRASDAVDFVSEHGDALCLRAFEALSGAALSPAAQRLMAGVEAAQPGGGARLVRALRYAPQIRSVSKRAEALLQAASPDASVALRLAYRQVTREDPTAGPEFIDLLVGQFPEPNRVLRLVSAVMDRPSDRFLADSELAHLGEALASDIDHCIAEVGVFDPHQGTAAAAAAAAAVARALFEITEFDKWLSLTREGPLARRLASQRRQLALAVERRLHQIPVVMSRFIPVERLRISESARQAATSSFKPDPAVVGQLTALLTFAQDLRGCAANGGFGALRSDILDDVDSRLERYGDALIDVIQTGRPELAAVVRECVSQVADCLSLVREPRAGQMLRRRAAA